MRICALLVTVVLLPLTASAADIDGRWNGTVSTPDGEFPLSYTFQADGDTLTGSMFDGYGEKAINDGKIDGDTISFSVRVDYGGGPFTLSYTGVVADDQNTLTSVGDGQRSEFVIMRALVSRRIVCEDSGSPSISLAGG